MKQLIIILVLLPCLLQGQITRSTLAKSLKKSSVIGSLIFSDLNNEAGWNSDVIWTGTDLEISGDAVWHEGNMDKVFQLSGVDAYYIAGNVGIGLTNPNYTLDMKLDPARIGSLTLGANSSPKSGYLLNLGSTSGQESKGINFQLANNFTSDGILLGFGGVISAHSSTLETYVSNFAINHNSNVLKTIGHGIDIRSTKTEGEIFGSKNRLRVQLGSQTGSSNQEIFGTHNEIISVNGSFEGTAYAGYFNSRVNGTGINYAGYFNAENGGENYAIYTNTGKIRLGGLIAGQGQKILSINSQDEVEYQMINLGQIELNRQAIIDTALQIRNDFPTGTFLNITSTESATNEQRNGATVYVKELSFSDISTIGGTQSTTITGMTKLLRTDLRFTESGNDYTETSGLFQVYVNSGNITVKYLGNSTASNIELDCYYLK